MTGRGATSDHHRFERATPVRDSNSPDSGQAVEIVEVATERKARRVEPNASVRSAFVRFIGRLDAPVEQGLSDELGKRVSIGRSLRIESLEHPKAIVVRAVLPELEFSLHPIDWHFEGDDGCCQLFVNVHREIFHAPGLLPALPD